MSFHNSTHPSIHPSIVVFIEGTQTGNYFRSLCKFISASLAQIVHANVQDIRNFHEKHKSNADGRIRRKKIFNLEIFYAPIHSSGRRGTRINKATLNY